MTATGGPAPASRHPWHWRAALLVGLLALALILSPFVGPVPIPPRDVAGIVLEKLTGGTYPANACPDPVVVAGQMVPCPVLFVILWDARIPELLLAALVGAGLALAGGTMQGVFRNPLGDPYLLGISSGAALGAAAVFVFGVGSRTTSAEIALPVFAFGGAMGTGAIVLLASRSPRATSETLLLTGVALGAFFSALIALLTTLRPSAAALPLTFWILGGFAAATWTQVAVVFAAVVAGGALLSLHGRDLDLLQLGDESARGLGSDVRVVRERLLALSALVTAVCVAFSGIIGFVGLIAPHVVRRVQGPSYGRLLPVAAVFGALFLLIADDVADSVLGGGGLLPVGVVTSFVGGPFFLWILYRRGPRGST
ncbi:MAG: iron ABC transporter permease [Thermoplasmata archaeon]|nr:iron ABC transporter permease [Thermoplasmata archaeon]